jgi:hypothetical protein
MANCTRYLGLDVHAETITAVGIPDHREREDRAIVNGQIGHREREDRPS